MNPQEQEYLRDLTLNRLKKAGWLSAASVVSNDATPNTFVGRFEWTDYGKQRRLVFHSIFAELGYIPGPRRGGEFNVLLELCRVSPNEDMSKTGEAPKDHPRP